MDVLKRDTPILFRPHSNGFFLQNEDCILRYTSVSGLSRDNLNLVFNQKPKLSLSSQCSSSNYFPCTYIIAENPDHNEEPRTVHISDEKFRLK
ncbi:hypothetical protein J4456_01645 [Candidatus Pacearchaeota archaeon]|nr:hypothetical protein [Candidatus Pacearchaeota archaeon]